MERFRKACEQGATGDSLAHLAEKVQVQTSRKQPLLSHVPVPSLFLRHNRTVACRYGAQCRTKTTTCRFRHWDYCVQYYLFGRCSCNAGYDGHKDRLEGHVSSHAFRLASETSPAQLRAMWQQLLDERHAAEVVRAAEAARQRKEWEEQVRLAEEVRAKQQAEAAAHWEARQRELHEAQVAATSSIADFLKRASSSYKCPHYRSLQEDERELLVNLPLQRPPHNVKKVRRCYPVCPVCFLIVVDAQPQDVVWFEVVPSRTLKEASPALLVRIRAILDRIATYKTGYLRELEDAGICRDIAQLVLAHLW
jgi:hypothetical protein